MKALKIFTTLALMAMPLMLTTSCDDDDWYPWYGDNVPWWYGYDDGDWGWDGNNYDDGGDYDGGGFKFNDGSSVLDEAEVLAGEWDGSVAYKYGDTGQEDDFYATFTFSRNNNKNAIKGTGTETDYLLDSNKRPTNVQKPLNFNWYIDQNTGDIYIHYLTDKNSTFVMDIDSKNVGFYLSEADGIFQGYMTGTNNNDLIYINLNRQTNNEAKAATRAGGKNYRSFGTANSIKVFPSGGMRLNNRR